MDDNVLEAIIERFLKGRLENHGFLVLKLITPAYNGTPDRLILFPKYAPACPAVCETKRPKSPRARALQLHVHREWLRRGVRVLDVVFDHASATRVADLLISEVSEKKRRAMEANNGTLNPAVIDNFTWPYIGTTSP